jgi:hypothetical protein
LHQPKCSVESGNGILQALQPYHNFKIFTRWPLAADFFDDVDMIAVPGGIGDADSFDHLLAHNGDRVRDFVRHGGRYLGVCMGAYWADKYYFDILEETRVEQYIAQPGTDTRRPHPKAMPVNWQGYLRRMYFYDGCTFIGGEQNVYATYDTGYSMAIIQNRIGLIGCHPESQQYWYDRPAYLKKHWHGGYDNRLLLEFVDTLMEI